MLITRGTKPMLTPETKTWLESVFREAEIEFEESYEVQEYTELDFENIILEGE